MSIVASIVSVFCLESIGAYTLKEEQHEESLINLKDNDSVVILLSGQNVDLQNADYYKNLDNFMNEIHSESPRVFISNEHQSRWLKLCAEIENLEKPLAIVSDRIDPKILKQFKDCLTTHFKNADSIKWVNANFDNSTYKSEWKRDLASIISK